MEGSAKRARLQFDSADESSLLVMSSSLDEPAQLAESSQVADSTPANLVDSDSQDGELTALKFVF